MRVAIARRLRTGMVHLNGASVDMNAPFGGYKQSGNGREWGREGLKEFLGDESGDGVRRRWRLATGNAAVGNGHWRLAASD